MKSRNHMIYLLLVFAILLTACRKDNVNTVQVVPEPNIESLALAEDNNTKSEDPDRRSASFDFELPAGFKIENVTDTDCSITYADQCVGGFVLTNIDSEIFDDPDGSVIIPYLESYITPPLVFEYMMGYSENNPAVIDISLNIVDLETEVSHEYKHYLFEKNSDCYDMWLDTELVEDEALYQLLVTTGIDITAEYDSEVS